VRRVIRATLFATLLASPLAAQQDSARPTARPSDEVRERIEQVRRDPSALRLPATDSITVGGRTVPAGSRVAGTVAAAGGTLEVFGQVGGDAIAIDGDVVVHPGARVDGNAFAAGGRVRLEGGTVGGEIRTLGGAIGPIPERAAARGPSTMDALQLALGWLAILIIVGIAVLVAASDYLDGVVDALERSFARALLTGIAGQLAILPVMILGVVALAITLIGILLIPFAIVAYALAVAGLLTLGFLAVASVTGRWLRRPATRGLSERGEALRALVVGIAAYMALWIVAAAFTWSPLVGGILRVAAFALTWVGTTAGLGAAIISRGGTRREEEVEPPPSKSVDELSWMTPTPVTGVVAARRPTPTASLHEPR
jgi:hypothetical protein